MQVKEKDLRRLVSKLIEFAERNSFTIEVTSPNGPESEISRICIDLENENLHFFCRYKRRKNRK